MKHLKPFQIFESVREIVPANEIKRDMKVFATVNGKTEEWKVIEVFKSFDFLLKRNNDWPIENNYILTHENIEELKKNVKYILDRGTEFQNETFIILTKFDDSLIDPNEDIDGAGVVAKIVVYGKNDINFTDDKEIVISKFMNNLAKTGLFESVEDYHFNIPHKQIVYYHIDTHHFEYKLKLKDYNIKPSVAAFLKNKDYLILVKDGKAVGYASAKKIANKMETNSTAYKNKDLYNDDMFILKSAKLNKLNDKTGLFN